MMEMINPVITPIYYNRRTFDISHEKMIEADIKKIDNNIQFNNYFIDFQNKIFTNPKCYRYKLKIVKQNIFYDGDCQFFFFT